MKVKVDVAEHTAIAVCGCGWRGLAVALTRIGAHDQALVRAAAHERVQHPDDRHARAALASYRKRHADAA